MKRIRLRKEVRDFAVQMELKLRKHDVDRRMDLIPYHDFFEHRLWDELREWMRSDDPKELVDVANFCMMIYLWGRKPECKDVTSRK